MLHFKYKTCINEIMTENKCGKFTGEIAAKLRRLYFCQIMSLLVVSGFQFFQHLKIMSPVLL